MSVSSSEGSTATSQTLSRETSLDESPFISSVDPTQSTTKTEGIDAVVQFYQTYDVKELLGKGVSSTVCRCVERSTKQEFAVKIIDVSTEKQPQREAAYLRKETLSEVNLLRLLAGHPYIISLHDFYDGDTFMFVVFEMAAGGELFDALNKAVTFSEKRTKRVMRQIFEGVQHMIQHNIVHRDLKLENILCLSGGDGTPDVVKITDFGFAQQLTKGQRLTDLCGTKGYLSPEIFRCRLEGVGGCSFEADMWACGVIMYTLLAGYAPFYHRNQYVMMRKIRESKFDLDSEPWNTIGDSPKDLICRLLEVEVNKRATVEEALKHPFLSPQPVEAPMPTLHTQIRRKPFRNHVLQVRQGKRIYDSKMMIFDPVALRQRPYSDKQIRHESDAAVFAIFGHWISKGFSQSRDVLFATRPIPLRSANSA